MAETKQQERVSSGEPLETPTVKSPPEAANAAESSEAEKPRQSSKQTIKAQAGALLEITTTHGYPLLVGCAKFLKRTRRLWLIAAGAIFGLMAVVGLVERLSERARYARERRHDQALASVTPDTLIARCGQPAEDATKEVYPILMRTISYQLNRNENLLLVFSRTAEEKSDWVFLAMKDESGARIYDSTEAKIAALPCLDSKK